MRAEVSFCHNLIARVSFFPVGRIVGRQEPSQQLENPTVTSPGFIPAIFTTLPRRREHLSIPVPPVTPGTSAPVSTIQQIQKQLDPTDTSCQKFLLELLSHQGLTQYIEDLQEHDLEGSVEFLDQVSEADNGIHRC